MDNLESYKRSIFKTWGFMERLQASSTLPSCRVWEIKEWKKLVERSKWDPMSCIMRILGIRRWKGMMTWIENNCSRYLLVEVVIIFFYGEVQNKYWNKEKQEIRRNTIGIKSVVPRDYKEVIYYGCSFIVILFIVLLSVPVVFILIESF